MIGLFFILASLFPMMMVHARVPAGIEYNCQFTWATLNEKPEIKKLQVRESGVVNFKKNIQVNLGTTNDIYELKITETYPDNAQNFFQYSYKCDRSLNCSGERLENYNKKSRKTILDIRPMSSKSIGTIKGREVFEFNFIKNDGFLFQYILYRNDNGEPMGLSIECRD